jgi:hypothetical protein
MDNLFGMCSKHRKASPAIIFIEETMSEIRIKPTSNYILENLMTV